MSESAPPFLRLLFVLDDKDCRTSSRPHTRDAAFWLRLTPHPSIHTRTITKQPTGRGPLIKEVIAACPSLNRPYCPPVWCLSPWAQASRVFMDGRSLCCDEFTDSCGQFHLD